MINIIGIKKKYYQIIDDRAKTIAKLLSKNQGNKFSADLIMETVAELYTSAKITGFHSESFESAYHGSITADFEFFISRILGHYSDIKNLNWKIYVRRQTKKGSVVLTPDIRIEKKQKTLAIIEVKTKVGWMQPVFNSDTVKNRLVKFNAGQLAADPRIDIQKNKEQISKYIKGFGISKDRMYMLVPTLKEAHRANSKPARDVAFFISNFSKNSNLPSSNLILLSNNLRLNLSTAVGKDYQSTNHFEKFIYKISKK
jgi:hypothetical protein